MFTPACIRSHFFALLFILIHKHCAHFHACLLHTHSVHASTHTHACTHTTAFLTEVTESLNHFLCSLHQSLAHYPPHISSRFLSPPSHPPLLFFCFLLYIYHVVFLSFIPSSFHPSVGLLCITIFSPHSYVTLRTLSPVRMGSLLSNNLEMIFKVSLQLSM